MTFYPRSPCGERPVTATLGIAGFFFLSTLSLRRATNLFAKISLNTELSIHALLAESDPTRWQMISPTSYFLSTLSLRRATVSLGFAGLPPLLSIHALLAESDA